MGSVYHCITFSFNLYHLAPKQLYSLVLNSRWWLRGPGQQETSAWHKHTLCLCCRKVTCRTQQWLFFDITNMLQYIGVVGVIDYKNLHFRVMSFFFIRISMLFIGCHFYGAFGKHMPVTSRGCRWRTTWVLCEVFKKLKREKIASKAEWRPGKISNPMGQWRPVPRVFLWKT